MRKSKFTEEQIRLALEHVAAGVPLEELCRKYGGSAQSRSPRRTHQLGPNHSSRERKPRRYAPVKTPTGMAATTDSAEFDLSADTNVPSPTNATLANFW